MPTQVMQGIRILEVAEHTFVPAASALLAEYGAEVIKVEHVERGDAMRGLASTGVVSMGGGVHVLLEHSNRGKKSIGVDLSTEEGLDVLYRLAATCDVFLTNKLPGVRQKLKIEVEDIRAHNDKIIYVRGTGQGDRGPEADAGSYDSLSYWCRSGVAAALTQPDDAVAAPPPAPAFGDSIGAMTIAGGIMGALLHRERTGEATEVDVSLLSVGLWSMGAAVALSLQLDMPWGPMPRTAGSAMGNPLVGTFPTQDRRFVGLCCLQAGKYWADACEALGHPEWLERFPDAESFKEDVGEVSQLVRDAFLERTGAEWEERLRSFSGQWAMVQNTIEAANDRQSEANDYVQEYATSDGTPFRMVAPPVQYDGGPPPPLRAPEFNEHGDAILEELGLDWDTIVDLKVRGVVT